MDFETTRNDANVKYGIWTCYTDGSRMDNHSGYGYAITRVNRTIYKDYDYMGPRATARPDIWNVVDRIWCVNPIKKFDTSLIQKNLQKIPDQIDI
jgi:hypothetical protein